MSTKPPDPAEFDRYAGDYDSLLRDPIRDRFAGEKSFFVERKLDVILRLLRSLNIDTQTLAWLDVGCGRGELLRLGRPHFGEVVGCDPSERMLEACKDLGVRHQPEMTTLPFPDASFDLISVVCVYHHVKEEQRATLTRARSSPRRCPMRHRTQPLQSRDPDHRLQNSDRRRRTVAYAAPYAESSLLGRSPTYGDPVLPASSRKPV